MNNNNTERSWETVLSIEGVDLGELYETVGVRDVLTTLNNTVNTENNEIVGMTELAEEQEQPQRAQVSLSDIMGEGMQRGETTTLSGVTGNPQRMGLADAMGINTRNQTNTGNAFDFSSEDASDIVVDTLDEDNLETYEETSTDRNQNHEIQNGRVPQRNEQRDGGNAVAQNNTISLNDLFARQTTLADLDNQGVVTLSDIQDTDLASTYTRPDLTEITDSEMPILEFGEDVVEVVPAGYGSVTFDRYDYDTFNHNTINKRNEELERATQARVDQMNEKEDLIKGMTQELFGRRLSNMYGYDKIGRTSEGVPYVKAVLATRFTKLNDRRFRKPEEMRRRSRNVAVANKLQSVKAFIEMTVTKAPEGNYVVSVVDSEGEHLTYLEQKFAWLVRHGYELALLPLYMKTQLAFEDPITDIEQMKTVDFWRD